MHAMFDQASSFDQPLDMWDVSSVTDMSWMFYDATSFDQPLETWDVSSVKTMQSMFNGAETFNQNLCQWFNMPYQELPFVLDMFDKTNCADKADPDFVTKKSFCGMCT
jgi:surface protein